MNKLFKGQTKAVINLEINATINDVATAEIGYVSPNGVRGFWTATHNAAVVSYTIQSANDLFIAGEWKIFVRITHADNKVSLSSSVPLRVFEPGTD